jgi:mannosyltransferase
MNLKLLTKLSAPMYLGLTIIIGAIFRYIDIAKSSIWHDEGYTMMLAPDGPIEILARTGRDVHPPLYYIALHYWMLMFGNSELAARSLSAISILALIPLIYLLVKRLYNNELAARVAALFIALAPFLVRYSQEARMYGMVAFLLCLSTYAMVRAIQDKAKAWWVIYALALAAALYTHYYSVFMIVVQWVYVASLTNRKHREGLFNPYWWGANVGAALLFIPWVPTAYAQFTRVQGSFWIPKPSTVTLPNTLLQFLVYNSVDQLAVWIKVVIAAGFVALVGGLFIVAKKYWRSSLLLTSYALLGPVLVVLLSYKRPIYVDRYFVFAAVGFYALLGVIMVLGWPFAKRPRLQLISVALTCGFFIAGIGGVYYQGSHQMKKIGEVVNSGFQPGDIIISGELYTFFDFSYYNHTGEQTKLWSKNGVNGYGETSLIYDRADQIVVRRLSDLRPASGFIWVVGKTGSKEYYDHVPSNWYAVGDKQTFSGSAVQKYQVLPQP